MPPCPRCSGAEVKKDGRIGETQRYRCRSCCRTFIARTGTPFAGHRWPQEIIVTAVRWYVRFRLSAADVRDLLAERGVDVSARTVLYWFQKFAPLLARAGRRAATRPGARWWCDETYVRVGGKWAYLYRAIDRDGNLVDALLSEKRDMAAAQRFFAQALELVGQAPEQVTTDGHDAYPRAIRETLGDRVIHRTSRDKNKRIAQDHRGVKQRYYPLRGFGAFASAARCCSAFEEQRQYFRVATRSRAYVSLGERRRLFQDRWATVMAELAAA